MGGLQSGHTVNLTGVQYKFGKVRDRCVNNGRVRDGGKGNRKSRYQLRSAAGGYWLLDMEQEGVPYKNPLSVNEVGAEIWRRMEEGLEREKIVDCLCQEYQAERAVVSEDVERFQEKLRKFGFSPEQESGKLFL